jgi:Mn2+/Fe2+ NRAMP family transporter
VEPIIPELYELCENANQASLILARAKLNMESLWVPRRFLIIASGAVVIIIAVIVASVMGFFSRGGSPERWIVVPGVALGFVLPIVVHTSILRVLRRRFRERLQFERTLSEKRQVGGMAEPHSARP